MSSLFHHKEKAAGDDMLPMLCFG